MADHFDPKVFPVAAVADARQAHLTGRIYSEFIWGGYLLYAWPEQKVFIDGGTDHYGQDLVQEHLRLASLMPGWRDVLTRWDISLALLATGRAAGARAGARARLGACAGATRRPCCSSARAAGAARPPSPTSPPATRRKQAAEAEAA